MPSRDPAPSGTRVAELVRYGRTAWRLLRDPAVPIWIKAIPALGLLYLASPIDVVPELLAPVIGPLAVADDLAVLIVALRAFVHVASRHAAEPDREPPADVVDATYRVADRP